MQHHVADEEVTARLVAVDVATAAGIAPPEHPALARLRRWARWRAQADAGEP